MDTQRMLQPQGLFQPPPPAGPQPWPGSGPAGNLFAPPLPGAGGPGPLSSTLPGGMQPVPPDGPFPPAGSKRQLRLPSGPVTAAIIAAALVLVVALVFAMSRSSGGTGGGTTAGATPASTVSPPAGTAARQAAAQLSVLLAQSGTDRADVVDAVENVRACGKNLARDERIFTTAAANRRALLSKLGSLPGRSALPAAMLSELSGAWRASAQVDTDLARWASDAAARGCHKGNPGDASLRASSAPDSQATADKQAFARLWNPLARRYGLPTYQWQQL
ncbi:MAG TPA: hypothetical protein VKV38_02635 [Trebonia sp.]|nr:hypothetical protein [Trebonia sp.]